MKRNWNIFLNDALSLLTCKELDNWFDLIERKRCRRNRIDCLILWWMCAYYQSTPSHRSKENKAIYLYRLVALITQQLVIYSVLACCVLFSVPPTKKYRWICVWLLCPIGILLKIIFGAVFWSAFVVVLIMCIMLDALYFFTFVPFLLLSLGMWQGIPGIFLNFLQTRFKSTGNFCCKGNVIYFPVILSQTLLDLWYFYHAFTELFIKSSYITKYNLKE